jgi:hypothetical protein
MNGEPQFAIKPAGGWYEIDLREFKHGILLSVWASIRAVEPDRCAQPDVHKLIWPGDREPMTEIRTGDASTQVQFLYLKDSFLERYEQKDIFDTVPVRTPDGLWTCSPSYGGEWSFVGCQHIGRNLIRVQVYDLYKKAVPDREIVHAHAHAVNPDVAERLKTGEHIVAKSERVVDQVLDLGDHLSALGNAIGLPQKRTEALVGFPRREPDANGWRSYPILSKLARVAPLEMTEQAFLARCKTLNELLQKALPNDQLKALLQAAGVKPGDLQTVQSLRLLQGLVNLADALISQHQDLSTFKDSAADTNWNERNAVLAPLFVTYDLRIADAHEAAGWQGRLQDLAFDVARLRSGHGLALDFMFDQVINALRTINLLAR